MKYLSIYDLWSSSTPYGLPLDEAWEDVDSIASQSVGGVGNVKRNIINKRNPYGTKNDIRKGVSSLGGAGNTSMKVRHSMENAGELTYIMYLAQAGLSGHFSCSKGNCKYCMGSCLGFSGQTAVNILKYGGEVTNSQAVQTRIARTRALFEDRDAFMVVLCHEIMQAKLKAERLGLSFSVRLNGTSDIDVNDFRFTDEFVDSDPTLSAELKGKNIVEIFYPTQFYDYTKDYERAIKVLKKNNELRASGKEKSNYHVDLSYNGMNWKECEEFLREGGKVAMIFENTAIPRSGGVMRNYKLAMREYAEHMANNDFSVKPPRHPDLPKSVNGFQVIDGNLHDVRYRDLDEQGNPYRGVIVGLAYRLPFWMKSKDPAIRAKMDTDIMNPKKNGFCVTPENHSPLGDEHFDIEW